MAIDELLANLCKPPEISRATGWKLPSLVGHPAYAEFTQQGGHGYTADGMFHFFGPMGAPEHDIKLWNSNAEWHHHFGVDKAWTSIAEDAFGHQFCLRPDNRRPVIKVLSLWTGSFTVAATDFTQFVKTIILMPSVWQSLHELYQKTCQRNRMIFRPWSHLSPTLPPICGGHADEPTDFEWINATTNMSILGQLYDGLRHLPPGTPIKGVQIDRNTGVVSFQAD